MFGLEVEESEHYNVINFLYILNFISIIMQILE